MALVKVGINGFGRIGRNVFRAACDKNLKDMEIVAVNDLTDPATLAYLLKHDSTFGTFKSEVSYTDDSIIVDGKKVKVFKETDPSKLPWKELGVDIEVLKDPFL